MLKRLTCDLFVLAVAALGSVAQAGIVTPTYVSSLSSPHTDTGTFPSGPNALATTGKLTPDVETGATLTQAEAARFTAGTLGGWATVSSGTNNYYASYPAPILAWDLGAVEDVNHVVLWQYDDNGNGNQLRGFSMAYSTDGVHFTAFSSVGSLAAGTEAAQVFNLGGVTARYIEIRLDSNYHSSYPTNGGDRVGLGQIRFDALAVPEPGSLTLMGLAVVGLTWGVSRRNRSRLRPAAIGENDDSRLGG
jgi:hypothetical protein